MLSAELADVALNYLDARVQDFPALEFFGNATQANYFMDSWAKHVDMAITTLVVHISVTCLI